MLKHFTHFNVWVHDHHEALATHINDCQATYDELTSKGVEFREEPTQRPNGVDTGFRDPSGDAPGPADRLTCRR